MMICRKSNKHGGYPDSLKVCVENHFPAVGSKIRKTMMAIYQDIFNYLSPEVIISKTS